MANMSYCRFENTVQDLGDCSMALEELFSGDAKPLSKTEFNKARELVTICADIMMLIQEHSGLDVEEFSDKMDRDPQKVIIEALNHAQESAKNNE